MQREHEHNMSLTAENVRAQLQECSELSPLKHVEVEDISGGCGTSFSITVVTDSFASKSLLDRHRMIHASLGSKMKDIHALKLKCLTPEKFTQS